MGPKKTFEQFTMEAKKLGFTFNSKKSKKYVGSDTKYYWTCPENHDWLTKFENLKKECKYCKEEIRKAKVRKKVLEKLSLMAAERKISFKEEDYKDSVTKIRWSCADNHDWMASPGSVLQGQGCPECWRLRRAGNSNFSEVCEWKN